jgi:DNA-binding response OmpR family regulator
MDAIDAGQRESIMSGDVRQPHDHIVEDGGARVAGTEMYRALVLHESRVVADLVKLTLNHGLFVVNRVCNLAEAEASLALWRPHIAIIDMDHDDSTALLERLGVSRQFEGRATPVLGLARRGDLASKLQAFDLGVDDVLAVPFSPEELLARCIVITRRAIGKDQPMIIPIKIGEIELDILGRLVHVGESVIHLSSIEQSLLYLLASRGGQVVDRETILDIIWGSDFVAESNVVDRHIRCLRIKLQDGYKRPRFIATVPGQGYRFIPTFSNSGWEAGANEASTSQIRRTG